MGKESIVFNVNSSGQKEKLIQRKYCSLFPANKILLQVVFGQYFHFFLSSGFSIGLAGFVFFRHYHRSFATLTCTSSYFYL